MAGIHADIDALKGLHGALVRYRHAQREVAARGEDQVRATRSALAEKASQLRAQVELAQGEYAACRERAAQADPEDLPVDCSGYARAVEQSSRATGADSALAAAGRGRRQRVFRGGGPVLRPARR